MKKIIKINGMSCMHCQARVEKALNALEGVQAKVDLGKKQAEVTLSEDIPDDILMNTVNQAGYEAVSVSVKKGLFS